MGFGIGEAAAIAAIVGAGAAIAGTAVTTIAATRQAQQQSYAAEAQASEIEATSQINQQLADAEAQNQISAAEYDEHQFRRRAALLMGKQAAIYGASGVDPSSGSPLVMTLDTVRQAEMEAQNIKRSGQMGASSTLFRAQANARASEFEANLQRWVSQNTRGQIPYMALGGGLSALGQGTSALSQWMRPIRYSSGTGLNPDYRTSMR
jgi:hypothetical protein